MGTDVSAITTCIGFIQAYMNGNVPVVVGVVQSFCVYSYHNCSFLTKRMT